MTTTPRLFVLGAALLSAGCASLGFAEQGDGFQVALAQMTDGNIGTIPADWKPDGAMREASAAPAQEYRIHGLMFSRLENGEICFVRSASSSSYDATLEDDFDALSGFEFRVEAFETMTGLPPRTIMNENAPRLDKLSNPKASGATIHTAMHYSEAKNAVTDEIDNPYFSFEICGKAPPITAKTTYVTVGEHERFDVPRKIYVFAVTDSDAPNAPTL